MLFRSSITNFIFEQAHCHAWEESLDPSLELTQDLQDFYNTFLYHLINGHPQSPIETRSIAVSTDLAETYESSETKSEADSYKADSYEQELDKASFSPKSHGLRNHTLLQREKADWHKRRMRK